MADTAPAANAATEGSVPAYRCPAADVLVCKSQPLSWASSARAKFVLYWQKPKCHCNIGYSRVQHGAAGCLTDVVWELSLRLPCQNTSARWFLTLLWSILINSCSIILYCVWLVLFYSSLFCQNIIDGAGEEILRCKIPAICQNHWEEIKQLINK